MSLTPGNCILLPGTVWVGAMQILGQLFPRPLARMALHGIRIIEARRLGDLAPNHAPEIGSHEIPAALVRGMARQAFLEGIQPLSALALGSSASTALASNGTSGSAALGFDLRDRQRPARLLRLVLVQADIHHGFAACDDQHRREHCPGDLVDLETIHVNCDVPEAVTSAVRQRDREPAANIGCRSKLATELKSVLGANPEANCHPLRRPCSALLSSFQPGCNRADCPTSRWPRSPAGP